MSVRVILDAADPKAGLTLAELADFVVRARTAGCQDDDAVKATVTMRGRVKSVTLLPAETNRR